MPVGETQSGKEILDPKTVVLVSAFETFIKTRVLRRYFWKAVLFSWTVIWVVEPELKNSGNVRWTSLCGGLIYWILVGKITSRSLGKLFRSLLFYIFNAEYYFFSHAGDHGLIFHFEIGVSKEANFWK